MKKKNHSKILFTNRSGGLVTSGLFALLSITAAFACADEQASVKPRSVVLPDGNVRDQTPTPETVTEIGRQSLKNMILFKAGSFEMGDWGEQVSASKLPFDGSADSKPVHQVKLSSFSIGKFPVTYAEFDIFTASLGLPKINQATAIQNYRKPNNPAGVTWQGATDYCKWLADITGKPFALPTEAQWEYAARSGGQRHVYPTDNGKRELGRNLPDADQTKSAGGLTEVSDFPPNMAGIYYMGANVHEWVADWYDPNYYASSPLQDPKGPATGSKRVVRGNFGTGGTEMTFKRWSWDAENRMKPWKKRGTMPGEATREIPVTKYSASPENAFRCAQN